MQPKAENYTERAWAAIEAAQNLALIHKNQYIETEHLFLSLINQNDFEKQVGKKDQLLTKGIVSEVNLVPSYVLLPAAA